MEKQRVKAQNEQERWAAAERKQAADAARERFSRKLENKRRARSQRSISKVTDGHTKIDVREVESRLGAAGVIPDTVNRNRGLQVQASRTGDAERRALERRRAQNKQARKSRRINKRRGQKR
jgi:hypothetical protein